MKSPLVDGVYVRCRVQRTLLKGEVQVDLWWVPKGLARMSHPWLKRQLDDGGWETGWRIVETHVPLAVESPDVVVYILERDKAAEKKHREQV